MATDTDIRIIKQLQKNGRATYAEIASVLEINSSTVAKRIESMIKNNIMDIRAMPNPYKLGLKAGAFIAVKVGQDRFDEVCNKLAGNFYISTFLSILGSYDFFFLVQYQTWEQMNAFITDELAMMTGVVNFKCYFIKETVKRYHHLFGDGRSFKESKELKELDWELIKHLTIDGRVSNSELADRLGLHVSTVSRRITSLLEKDMIRITSQPNPAKFGYSSSAIITAFVDMKQCNKICKRIYGYDEVFLLLKIINCPCLIIGLHTKTNEMIKDLINKKVINGPGIRKSEVFVRSRVIKSSYSWYLDPSYA